MEKEQRKERERDENRPTPEGRSWRDHPVEEEADKDIKEGGIEQTGQREKTGG